MATETAAAVAATPPSVNVPEAANPSMINKANYVGANFIDQERQFIEVQLNMDHTEELHLTPYVIEADENNLDFQDLMKLTTMDELHEMTWNTKKAESEAFIETAKAIMKDSGLLENETNLSKTKMFPSVVEAIFSNMSNEDDLFALKLALFELQDIRESDNVVAKTALRKAQNKIEILQHAFTIIDSLGRADVAQVEDTVAVTDPMANEKVLDETMKEIAVEKKQPAHQAKATLAKKTAATVAKNVAAAKKGKK